MDPKANTIGIFTDRVQQVACPNCNAELDVSDFRVFETILCPACQTEITVPGQLGSFTLLSELGHGAMGCVYLALDQTLGRHVALKVMRREFGENPEMLETLQREAKAMATLNHRNVVQVYSFGRESGQPYLVMELLDGERVDEMMREGSTIPEVRCLEIAMDVAEGLKAAHEAGMTHGDIKPANILMDREGVAKVVDFGLARFMDPDAEIEVWGTPYYIAPEKARKKGEDWRSDQYSLGATLFHALAGRPPFDGENPTKVVVAALKEDTPELKDVDPSLCPETSAVIRRMMDKSPQRRYPTYASMMADLRAALDSARRADKARKEAAAMEKAHGGPKQKSALWPILLTLLILAGGGVTALVLLQKQGGGNKPPVYEGVQREVQEPFNTVEIRKLEEAVAAIRRRDLSSASAALGIAARNIQSEHAARAWYGLYAGTIWLYAGHPDRARSEYERALKQDPILFDSGKVPPEDPRLLAALVLGTLEWPEFQRKTRKSAPWFQDWGELARGLRLVLESKTNDAVRHLAAYSEVNPSPMPWAYLLRTIAKDLHIRVNEPVPLPELELPDPPPKLILEAEKSKRDGRAKIEKTRKDFTGDGYVVFQDTTWMEWDTEFPATRELRIRYLATKANLRAEIQLNGKVAGRISFPKTGDGGKDLEWATMNVLFTMEPGKRVLRFAYPTNEDTLMVDRIEIR